MSKANPDKKTEGVIYTYYKTNLEVMVLILIYNYVDGIFYKYIR